MWTYDLTFIKIFDINFSENCIIKIIDFKSFIIAFPFLRMFKWAIRFLFKKFRSLVRNDKVRFWVEKSTILIKYRLGILMAFAYSCHLYYLHIVLNRVSYVFRDRFDSSAWCFIRGLSVAWLTWILNAVS